MFFLISNYKLISCYRVETSGSGHQCGAALKHRADVNERKTSLEIRTVNISVLVDRAKWQQRYLEPVMWVGLFDFENEFCQVPDKMVTPDPITRDVRPDFSPVSFNAVCMCTGIRVNKINGMIDGEVPE
ncbi:hypothetical protein J6590_072838 [Homalodisca vitripennis]|nr:hypothetical protein J6590_072838 [Homalodisca vitripennis]